MRGVVPDTVNAVIACSAGLSSANAGFFGANAPSSLQSASGAIEFHGTGVENGDSGFAKRPEHARLMGPDKGGNMLGSDMRRLGRCAKLDTGFNTTVPEVSMPKEEIYRRQGVLLLRIIPLVAEETCFALKVGMETNVNACSAPGLFVDIDLTYLPMASREKSLHEIDAAMRRIASRIGNGIPSALVDTCTLGSEDCVMKLVVQADSVQIKIEVTAEF
jgi:hypothetical protein